MTAAHCVNRLLYMVRLGAHDFTATVDENHEDVRVASYVAHTQFNKSLMINDIAIIHLNRDVQFNGELCSLTFSRNDRLIYLVWFLFLISDIQTKSGQFVYLWTELCNVKALKGAIRLLVISIFLNFVS